MGLSKMIKNKKLFIIGFMLFLLSLVLNFPFPHESPYGEVVLKTLNLPHRSDSGLYFIGIATLTMLIISLFFFAASVNKYRGRVVITVIIIALFAPPLLVSVFQKTLATGIYAVSYEREQSQCQFEMIDETTLKGKCELPFENFSKRDAQFTVEFYDKYLIVDDIQMVSLMNNNAPYTVTLKGRESRMVEIESNIDVSKMEKHIEQGSATFVNIIIKSGEKMRKL